MEKMNCSGWGKFVLGLAGGMAAGYVVGMTMAPSHRQLKRAAHQAAKKVNQVVEDLADAMDL